MRKFLKKIKTGTVLAVTALVGALSIGGSASASVLPAVLTPPTIPSSDSIFQEMLDTFGTAGTVGIAIIGGAVALGVVIILGMWGWRLAKKWLSAAK